MHRSHSAPLTCIYIYFIVECSLFRLNSKYSGIPLYTIWVEVSSLSGLALQQQQLLHLNLDMHLTFHISSMGLTEICTWCMLASTKTGLVLVMTWRGLWQQPPCWQLLCSARHPILWLMLHCRICCILVARMWLSHCSYWEALHTRNMP